MIICETRLDSFSLTPFLLLGNGKRRGLRVIYYWRKHAGEIWMLTICQGKTEKCASAHIESAEGGD